MSDYFPHPTGTENDFEETAESKADLSASQPLSVTDLTRRIKRLLETQIQNILVEGEISGFKAAGSGHLYFDLKDSGAIIHCIMWASDSSRLKFKPANGAKVELRGKLTVYDQRGQYQLTASSMKPAGLGKLYQEFLEMKEKLASEGLFDPGTKKTLPSHPATIGIVTSPTGAAIQDMINILTRRAPHIHVFIWPARVQGEGAAREIARGIQRFNSFPNKVDVLIVGRGGGSLEDLWAFNEEIVARAIHQSVIPVISAVGHETDTTISDYVADLRAPTPSAAAELVARDSGELINHLRLLQNRAYRAIKESYSFLYHTPHLVSRLESAVVPRVGYHRAQLREFKKSYGIQLPLQRVNQAKQHHDMLMEQRKRLLTDRLRNARNSQANFDRQLQNLNPKGILKRGYSITYNIDTGKILKKSADVAPGSAVNIILGEGQVSAQVVGGNVKTKANKSSKKRKNQDALDWFGGEIPDAE